ADAWVRVEVERLDAGAREGTAWASWALRPVETDVRRERVPTTNRGFAAVVEATVAASRLGVDAYDDDELRARLDYFTEIARTCGGTAERAAIERVCDLVGGA
ncbi:DUF447 family spectrin-like domain-containing protein, partial [Halarchaeum acidiphilum]